jgi:single-stranded-DNA-specific exonuclease
VNDRESDSVTVTLPLLPRYDWLIHQPSEIRPDVRALAAERGVGSRLLKVLARRGDVTMEELRSFVDPPATALHDPMLLPDAERFRERVRRAAAAGERAMVFGDFDADGLTGLAILTLALRRLGIDTVPYVPSRLDEGHGLSLAAVALATAEGRTLIVTVDCGTTSVAEIAVAADAGIDVLVTDHHAVPEVLPRAVAIVNAHRPDSRYPDPRLSGAGIAFKLAQALFQDGSAEDRAWALSLAELACIGSVADVVPIAGENRAILRLGIGKLSTQPRAGLAALLAAAGVDHRRVDVETIGFVIAPRINAVGRIGEAGAAVRLLLTEDQAEAELLAQTLQQANVVRREMMTSALDEAKTALAVELAADAVADAHAEPGLLPAPPLIVVSGPWPVGIIGLVAGRLAEQHDAPAVVFSTTVTPWRGSARGVPGFDLAAAFTACADLFERFGGHPMAAGCHLPAENYAAFRDRFRALAAVRGAAQEAPHGRRPLILDLVLRAESADYVLLRELSPLDEGADEPPLVGLVGFVVARARPAKGGHTQLTLRRGKEVLDAICFGRSDLTETLSVGQEIDVVARISSRQFGGLETLQLDIRDVAPAGWLKRITAAEAPVNTFIAVPIAEERAQALPMPG